MGASPKGVGRDMSSSHVDGATTWYGLNVTTTLAATHPMLGDFGAPTTRLERGVFI